jgi:hypothetical protein
MAALPQGSNGTLPMEGETGQASVRPSGDQDGPVSNGAADASARGCGVELISSQPIKGGEWPRKGCFPPLLRHLVTHVQAAFFSKYLATALFSTTRAIILCSIFEK